MASLGGLGLWGLLGVLVGPVVLALAEGCGGRRHIIGNLDRFTQ
jgi:hypothetical protein